MNKIKFNEVKFSNHFMNDRQHRGIGNDVIKELLEHGDYRHDGHNALVYFFNDSSFHNMKRDGMSIQQIEYFRKKRGIRLVVSHDKVVITAKYAYKNKERMYQ